MDERIDREDRAILAALDALETSRVDGPAAPAKGDEGALEREFHELLGLIPMELEPEPPSPEVKERLMASLPPRRNETRHGSGTAEIRPFRAPDKAPGRSLSSLLAVAASLTILALAFAAWLGVKISSQSTQLASVEQQLDAEIQARTVSDERLAEISEKLMTVTAPGIQVCLLRPTGDDPPQPAAKGTLFLSKEQRSWFLQARDLDPAPEGSAYVLWALDGEAASPLGVLTSDQARGGHGVQVAGDALPVGGGMTAVAVTLEQSRQTARPSGPMLLYGEQADMLNL
ncbi:MAG: anti-sigma factor [Acidobacteriota bacterium]